MGVFGLLRDMQQDDVIEAIRNRIKSVEARIERLETLVRALDAKLDRLTGEATRD